MIVILIMGVIYTLSIDNFKRLNDKSSSLTLLNLKKYLNSFKHTKSVKLLCLEDCSNCDVYVDGVKSKNIESFLDSSVKTYRYESSYGFIESEADVFFNADDVEEDVCFSYKIDKNGIGDQVSVEFKNQFYDLSTYFSDTVVYNSMEEMLSHKEELSREVLK